MYSVFTNISNSMAFVVDICFLYGKILSYILHPKQANPNTRKGFWSTSQVKFFFIATQPEIYIYFLNFLCNFYRHIFQFSTAFILNNLLCWSIQCLFINSFIGVYALFAHQFVCWFVRFAG